MKRDVNNHKIWTTIGHSFSRTDLNYFPSGVMYAVQIRLDNSMHFAVSKYRVDDVPHDEFIKFDGQTIANESI